MNELENSLIKKVPSDQYSEEGEKVR